MTWRRVAAGLLLITQLTACGSSDGGPDPDGPLLTNPDPGELCVLQPPDGLLTLGVEVTENTSDRKLTLQDVRLTKPEGMSIVGAKVMLIPVNDAHDLVGSVNGWPPALGSDGKGGRVTAAMLQNAPDLKGASVPAGDKTVSFVVGVKAKAGGSSGPLRVRYTDSDGHRFIWNGTTSYRAAPTSCGD